GALFGRVQGMAAPEDRGAVAQFFGPMDATPKRAGKLPDGLVPPELIVQDELHLISGPLGTMVGLYETAIEWLAERPGPTPASKPKILASTATVRRARDQIRALFGRTDVAVFPPPGVDESESWFATVEGDAPGRLYLGVAGQGRSMKSLLLRVYTALLAGAMRQHDPAAGEASPADPYLTLTGYFNALRELGGMRRLVEDEVRTRALQAPEKRPEDLAGPHPWFAERKVQEEPVELTSRRNAGEIKRAKARLDAHYVDKDKDPVDVLLASNMISVGVDIDRLGLMVVAGQPKTTAEYIQASSRVGRRHPGLVVTVFNLSKPRDRSHYERFGSYHESFYRFVEANSLTPFSGPALDRGLAGALVAMARLGELALTPADGAMRVAEHKERALAAADALAERVHRAGSGNADAPSLRRLTGDLRARARNLVDAWEQIVTTAQSEAGSLRVYSRFDREGKAKKALLFMVTEEELPLTSDERKFAAPTSMRDVEGQVHLWLERGELGGG
ncbi:MAG TPA: helicase-related protein, partial [Polyangiaceae bacterium LLY-WYZ-14_1]|nr:helicase-related protein [Polyangiaceae bacterium LLY-WYZ-14_1]